MGCPPQSDTLGRFGAEAFGVCDATFDADGGLGYRLPHRVNWGVAWRPLDGLRAELMGGWVGWSAFTDFMISISGVEELNEIENPETADLVNREQRWARANVDSFWLGLDGKYDIGDRWTVGGRALYDRSAIPDAAMSPNNYDADLLMLGALGAFQVMDFLSLGASFTRQIVATRTVTNSAFGVTLDPETANEERWFYPHQNGTYSSWVNRFGVHVRSSF
jgi:long-subunit fatty acid transport protein